MNDHTALLIHVQDAYQAARRGDATDAILAAYDYALALGADDIAEALAAAETAADLFAIEEALATESV